MPNKVLALQKEQLFDAWALERMEAHPYCYYTPTIEGIAVYDKTDELIEEYEYDSDPHYDESIR